MIKKRFYMTKTILALSFAALLLASAPVAAHAETAIEIIDNDFQNVSITVSGNNVHVSGASGLVLYVYNVAGTCIRKCKVDSGRYELTLPQGCYIFKVGTVVRKISIS